MIKWIARLLFALVVLRVLVTLPAHDVVWALGMWLLVGWMLYRAFPAMRDDVRRLVAAVPPSRLLGRGGKGGAF